MHLIIVVPLNLSQGVINSQVIPRGEFFYKKRYNRVSYAFNSKDKYLTGSISISEKDVILFNGHADLKGLLSEKDTHIYTRSFEDFFYIRSISFKAYVIYDFRALVSHESYFKNRSILRFLAIYLAEGLCYFLSNEVSTVSFNLKERLSKYYLRGRKVNVVPSLTRGLTQKTTESSLQSPGDDKELKLAYIGGASKWQNLELMLDICDYLGQNYNVKLLVITLEKDAFLKKLTHERKVKYSYEVISSDQSKVPELIRGSHFGFLLRENLILNRVASPIKFCEYLNSGVIPILTNYVGDYSSLSLKQGVGLIYDQNNPEQFYTQLKIYMNLWDECQERVGYVARKLTWEHFTLDSYLQLMA